MPQTNRINIRLPTQLKEKAKTKAARNSTTLTRIIIRALTAYVHEPDIPNQP